MDCLSQATFKSLLINLHIVLKEKKAKAAWKVRFHAKNLWYWLRLLSESVLFYTEVRKDTFFGHRTNNSQSQMFFDGLFISFWSSCNLFEAIERFTILFLKHVWSSNKKVTDVISPYRSYSQDFSA